MTASPADFLQEGLALHRRGAVAEAAQRYSEVLRADPRNADAHFYLGVIACQQGRFDEGAGHARTTLVSNPRDVRAQVLLGQALGALKRHEEAIACLDRALELAPDLIVAHGQRADLLCELGHYAEAIEGYDRALASAPNFFEGWFNRGTALLAAGRYEQAASSFDRAIALKSDFAPARLLRAKALADMRRYTDALRAVDDVLNSQPTLAQAWVGRANILSELDRHQEASAACDRALELMPNLAEAWLGRGNVLNAMKRHEAAIAAYDRALSFDPGLAGVWIGRGNAFAGVDRYEEALSSYEKVLRLKPSLAEAWLGHGNVLNSLKRYQEALASFDRAYRLQPDLAHLAGERLHTKMQICDWTTLAAEVTQVLTSVGNGRPASTPFPLLAIASSPADQLRCAREYVHRRPTFTPLWRGERLSHGRIRVAYLSADFHEHPNGHLTSGLFERHDRARFEVTGISFGPDQDSPVRRRIKSAFERFIDVRDRSDQEIADLVRQLEIDIAIDLMGFTLNNRLNVFARRPAPIQVNYLGYIGTIGAQFIDYVIADRIALPFDQQEYFDEKIVHLPDCFLPTDDRQEIAAWAPSRQEAGLPAEGFVFCSFNNSYKLTRTMFEAWIRILRAVPASVLWLAQANTEMISNLRREAQRLDLDPARIVFAPRLPLPQHLARQRLAGLFLDTVPYNAGATLAAALWAGVPVLTIRGDTFVGRMAASMLHAIDLPDLVTHNLDDYEALAIKLAREALVLAGIRKKLEQSRRRTPVFDTDRFRQNLEQAYITMIELHRRGEVPRSFSVAPHNQRDLPVEPLGG